MHRGMPISLCGLAAAVALLCAGESRHVIRTEDEVLALSSADYRAKRPFDLQGVVVTPLAGKTLILQVKNRFFSVAGLERDDYRPGDRVRIRGNLSTTMIEHRNILMARQEEILGHGPRVEPVALPLKEIDAAALPNQLVRTRGFIVNAKVDEIDPRWILLVLQQDEAAISVAVPNRNGIEQRLDALIDSEVEVTGTFSHGGGMRRFIGSFLNLPSPESLTILTPAPADCFASPALEDVSFRSSADIRRLRRRSVSGHVLAVWGGNKFLLREDGGNILRIELMARESPAVGDFVQAVGFPETDLYHLGLSRARFRKADGAAAPPDEPQDVSPEDVLLDADGRRTIQLQFHGSAISLRGTVRTLPSTGNGDGRFNLDCGTFSIPVDVSANPDAIAGLAPGSQVAVSGVCLMEAPTWQSALSFPTIDGFVLVVRTSADVKVLATPAWWTPERLLIVIGSLLTALLGLFVWNRILNRLVVRRSRLLMREEIARKGAELRIDERTRLAVELHDSLSQNLSGLACQISAVRKTMPADADSARERLDVAERMLTSSRTELKRCLWDLRGNTLDCPDMTEAVLRTVRPAVGDAELAVRFNVPRPRLPDTMAHAILCIVRELAANGVRHGSATRIQIAGARDGGRILFSVRDNGRGFDAAHPPSITEGHFGLSGIRERIDRLNGTFCLNSSPDGTVARAEIPFGGESPLKA